jgi:hypothetical protein
MNLIERAVELYKANPDPLTLDAIRVLANPDDPSYEAAATMICLLEELPELDTE